MSDQADQYKALATAIPGACVFLLDEHLTMIAAGGTDLLEVHGLDEADMLGKSVLTFTTPENVVAVAEMYTAILRGERRTLRNIQRGGRLYDLVGHPYRSSTDRPMVMVIMTDVSERAAELDRALAMAIRDELTGLYNRRGFLLLAEQRIAVATRAEDPIALGFADMDDLKVINDTYGHATGDAAIVTVAHMIERCCRTTDVASRIGGDEFVFLAVGVEAEAALRTRLRLEAARLEIRLSLAFTPLDPYEDLRVALDRADRAMYVLKRAQKRVAR